VSLGNFDNVATLTATNNVALAESPSLLINGGRIVDSSDTLGGSGPNIILQYGGNGDGWQADVNNNAFAVIELAGGKTYTIEGVRLSSAVKDFEVWVSSTTTDATAFTRVLAAAQTGTSVVSRFLFPAGPVQARYVKYIPKTGLGQVTVPGTNFFDVICADVGGIVDVSSIAGLGNQADMAIDGNAGTAWLSASTQLTNQFIKVRLSGARIHRINSVRITPAAGGSQGAPRDFDIKVSTTTSDDDAFTTVLSATAQNNSSAQEFVLSAPVDAKYVQLFVRTTYTPPASFLSIASFEVLETPVNGAVLKSVSSEWTIPQVVSAFAIADDTSNGPWITNTGAFANQFLVFELPGTLTVDRVVLQPGRSPFSGDGTIAAKNFDILVSTTDAADASFTTAFSGTFAKYRRASGIHLCPGAGSLPQAAAQGQLRQHEPDVAARFLCDIAGAGHNQRALRRSLDGEHGLDRVLVMELWR
jgi:hypothetical protein